MRRLLRCTAALVATATVVIAGFAVPVTAAEVTAEVTVRDTEFDPAEVRIEPGEAVRWTWEDGGHTVTGSGLDSGTLTAGSTYAPIFKDPGTYEYHCQIHSGMEGRVQVGPPADPPPPIEAPRIYVPSDVASLADAVEVAQPGTEILLDPRVTVELAASIVIETKDLTIGVGVPTSTTTTTSTTSTTSPSPSAGRGGTKRPAPTSTTSTTSTTSPPPLPARATVVPSGSGPEHAFVIRAEGVVLDDLAISDFRAAGVLVEQARYVEVRDTLLSGNRDYGIQAVGANVAVTDVVARGSRRAGVSLQRCDDCGVVTRLDASGNFVGFEAIDARAVVLRHSKVHGNANGVIVQTRPASIAGAAGADVLDNVIVDNDRTDAPAPTVFETEHVQPAAGVGVWLGGASDSQVRDNHVEGHRWGIVASVLGAAAVDDRITANTVGRSVVADLAWDGVGTGTCFSGNRSSEVALGEPTSRPAAIQTLYPCDSPLGTTVGVPDPSITADIAIASLTTYYCHELELGAC